MLQVAHNVVGLAVSPWFWVLGLALRTEGLSSCGTCRSRAEKPLSSSFSVLR